MVEVAVIGAGLVGALVAEMLAKRGYNITLFESRSDPSLDSISSRARSINLALSPRGIEAISSVDAQLGELIKLEGVKMRGRMIHSKDSTLTSQDYGNYNEGEYISSISRSLLSLQLLKNLQSFNSDPKLNQGTCQIKFNHKLESMNTRLLSGVDLKFNQDRSYHFDLIIGGDGAYSKVRQELMRGTRFNYHQYYAKHAYLELTIPTGPNDTYSISPDHLHIWPRGEFMLIALPNQDKSFTLTLFAYDTTFVTLSSQLAALTPGSPNPVVELFKKEVPDALALMGEEGLLKSWTENPKDGLVTIEFNPYHYEDKVLLIGDAAHAMVPFYGQGMNCAFEDVRVLSSLLDHFYASPSPLPPSPLPYSASHPALIGDPNLSPLAQALAAYTEIRTPSLLAIQQLAADNYAEMASKVTDPFYLIRLSLDGLLSKVFDLLESKKLNGRGGSWESLYRMVTFRYGLAYEEALARRAWQSRMIQRVGIISLTSILVGVGFVVKNTSLLSGVGLRFRR